MRRPWPKGLAALGLALLASTPALAQAPGTCASCAAQPGAPTAPVVAQPGATRIKMGHLCDACAAKMRKQGAPPTLMAGELHNGAMACTTCGNGSTAGYATVGGAVPGYALVGGTVPSGGEPTPIGVVQTSYGPQGGAAALRGPLVNAPVTPPPAPIPPPPSRRPHIISHIFFMSGRTWGEDYYAYKLSRREAKHAAIAYGEKQNTVNELPASVVYRQK